MAPRPRPVPEPTGAKLLAFRLVALVLGPLVFFGALEAGLRLGGAGYPTRFLVADTIGGRAVYRDNPHFARRYFPPPLYRSPRPFAVAREKDPKTYRIVVLGESAAWGDPDPAFGFSRMLQRMLEDRYPDRRFEVTNAAITAINSHAITEIAEECRRLSPDLFLVYMGHNEVVGTTTFGVAQAPLLLKRLRIGQMADRLVRAAAGPRDAPERWEGMTMFLGHEVAAGDAVLPRIHRQFERNLERIVATARGRGAKVLLSTLGTNLRDCPPFASKHRPGLSAEDEKKWSGHVAEGDALFGQGRFADALGAYAQAAALDDRHAELAFRQGRALHGAEKYEEAHRAFVRARDLDTLRFRADSETNDAIRRVGKARGGDDLRLMDVEEVFRRESPHGIPGEELLFEHVHMTFGGNYAIAREALLQMAAFLPGGAKEPLSRDEVARRLGFTPWHENKHLQDVLRRFRQPPFAGQLGAAERRARFVARQKALTDAHAIPDLAAMADAVRTQAANDPDWELHESLAYLLEGVGRVPDAIAEWERVVAAVPHNSEAHGYAGVLLFKAGRDAEALPHFQQARALRPDLAPSYNSMGAYHARQRQWAEAEREYKAALAIDPGSHEALINLGMTALAQNRRDQAKALYEKVKARGARGAEARLQLGLFAEALGLLSEAVQHGRDAVALEPELSASHVALAQMLRRQRRTREAAEVFEQALVAFPDSEEIHHHLAKNYMDVPDIERAIAAYRRIRARWPKSWIASANLAWILATAPDRSFRRGQEAIALAEEACQATGNRHPQALNTLAAAYAEAGRFEDAARKAEQAAQAAMGAGQRDMAQQIAQLVELYRQGRGL
jgi:tetratricopeptide (TPR) repeat protein